VRGTSSVQVRMQDATDLLLESIRLGPAQLLCRVLVSLEGDTGWAKSELRSLASENLPRCRRHAFCALRRMFMTSDDCTRHLMYRYLMLLSAPSSSTAIGTSVVSRLKTEQASSESKNFFKASEYCVLILQNGCLHSRETVLASRHVLDYLSSEIAAQPENLARAESSMRLWLLAIPHVEQQDIIAGSDISRSLILCIRALCLTLDGVTPLLSKYQMALHLLLETLLLFVHSKVVGNADSATVDETICSLILPIGMVWTLAGGIDAQFHGLCLLWCLAVVQPKWLMRQKTFLSDSFLRLFLNVLWPSPLPALWGEDMRAKAWNIACILCQDEQFALSFVAFADNSWTPDYLETSNEFSISGRSFSFTLNAFLTLLDDPKCGDDSVLRVLVNIASFKSSTFSLALLEHKRMKKKLFDRIHSLHCRKSLLILSNAMRALSLTICKKPLVNPNDALLQYGNAIVNEFITLVTNMHENILYCPREITETIHSMVYLRSVTVFSRTAATLVDTSRLQIDSDTAPNMNASLALVTRATSFAHSIWLYFIGASPDDDEAQAIAWLAGTYHGRWIARLRCDPYFLSFFTASEKYLLFNGILAGDFLWLRLQGSWKESKLESAFLIALVLRQLFETNALVRRVFWSAYMALPLMAEGLGNLKWYPIYTLVSGFCSVALNTALPTPDSRFAGMISGKELVPPLLRSLDRCLAVEEVPNEHVRANMEGYDVWCHRWRWVFEETEWKEVQPMELQLWFITVECVTHVTRLSLISPKQRIAILNSNLIGSLELWFCQSMLNEIVPTLEVSSVHLEAEENTRMIHNLAREKKSNAEVADKAVQRSQPSNEERCLECLLRLRDEASPFPTFAAILQDAEWEQMEHIRSTH
jgi:hypothetical protein